MNIGYLLPINSAVATTHNNTKTRPDNKFVFQIRSGEYEGLEAKLKSGPEWAPDFGSPEFVPSWGATVTGVRKFLIAYNVNLVSTKEQAHRIALNLRTQGRGKDQPGRLQVRGPGLKKIEIWQKTFARSRFFFSKLVAATMGHYIEVIKKLKDIKFYDLYW